MPNSRRPRTGRTVAALAAGAIAVNVTVAATVGALFPALDLLPRSEPPAPQAVADLTKNAEARAHRLTPTPAEQVLTDVLGQPSTSLLGRGWSAERPVGALHGTPFSYGCGSRLPDAAAPVHARARGARSSDAGMTVQLWAYGAGQATAARAALFDHLAACSGRGGIDPAVSTSSVADASGFTAFSSVDAQRTSWIVWQRGDVLASVAHTTLTGADAGYARRVATNVDASLLEALTSVCANLAPTEADVFRSPYGDGYRPHTQPVVVDAPDLPAVSTPNAAVPVVPLQVPAPVTHPDLAPPLPPSEDAYLDHDGDGFAESPPPVEGEPRGPAPVFADPAAFTVPSNAVTAAPVEPARPAAPASTTTVQVPRADPTGPGCGWEFTGQRTPHFDRAALDARADATIAQALVNHAAAAARYRIAEQRWLEDHRAWMRQLAAWEAYQELEAARVAATEAASAAQATYEEAVAVYAQLRTPPVSAPDPEQDSDMAPTPSPTPEVPPEPEVSDGEGDAQVPAPSPVPPPGTPAPVPLPGTPAPVPPPVVVP